MNRHLAFAGAALVSFAVAGCSNVEIDVDIYKGPLANHEDMQVQQLAAMAVAARPLLVALRDELAMADIARHLDPRFGSADRAKWRESGPEKYYDSICPAVSANSQLRLFRATNCSLMVGTRAERVNAILGLYEAKGGDFEGTFGTLVRLRYDLLERTQAESAAAAEFGRRWNAVEGMFGPRHDRKLAAALRSFLTSEGAEGRIGDLYGALVAPARMPPTNRAARDLAADGAWSAAVAALVSSLAREATKKELVDGVIAKAGSFLAQRAILESGLEQALALYANPDSLLRAQGIAAPTESQRAAVRADIAPFVGTMVQGEHVVLALDAWKASAAPIPAPLDGLAAAMKVEHSAFVQCAGDRSDAERTAGYRDSVRYASAIVGWWLAQGAGSSASAKAYAEGLKNLGSVLTWARARPADCARGTLLDMRLTQADRFRFGLARGPTFGNELDEAERAWSAAIGTAGLGLEDGRTARGLMQQIDAFLKSRAPAARPSRAGQSADVWPLLDSIADFATKTAFLADNDGVFSASAQSDSVKRYVAALQAVANQLTVQIDEVRRRNSHRERHAAAPATLATAVFRVTPERAIANLIEAVENVPQSEAADPAGSAARFAALGLRAVTAPANLTEKAAAALRASEGAERALGAFDTAVAPRLRAIAALGGDALRQTIAQAAAGLGSDDKTFAEFKTALETELRTRVRTPVANGPQDPLGAENGAISAYLAEIQQREGFGAKAKGETWAQRLGDVARNDARRLGEERAALAKAVADAKSELDATNATVEAAVHRARVAQIGIARKAAADALRAKRDELTRVYAAARDAQPATDPWPRVRNLLVAPANADAASRKRWELVAEVAAGLGAPEPRGVAEAMAALPKGATRLDALDSLVHALRFEHVEAVRRLGRDSAEARRIEQALDAAAEQRASMAYIMPAAAFLRMVNAASAIQPDPGLGAENRLQRSFWRGVPLIGSALGNLGEEQNLRSRADIDRQNWQNINRVRLDGAGRTNYALVKDDIGNWYAKGYSADPNDIVKAMRGLATFNLGARLPGLAPGIPARGAEVPASSRVDQGQMGRAFARFREQHLADLRKIHAAMVTLEGTGTGSLVATAKATAPDSIDHTKLAPIVDNAAKQGTPLTADVTIGANDDEVAKRRRLIVDRLVELDAFRRTVARGARSTAKSGQDQAAYTSMNAALATPISEQLDGLRASMERFENQTTILGQATRE